MGRRFRWNKARVQLSNVRRLLPVSGGFGGWGRCVYVFCNVA